jgi:hypothetical protein
MKLRKARKAPKRYDDYEWEEEDYDLVCATTRAIKAHSQQAIRIQPSIPAYNPNLRPAAFPTLDYRVPPQGSHTSVGPQPVLLNTKARSQINRFRNYQREGQKTPKPKLSVPPLYETPPDIQIGSMHDCLMRITAQRLQAEINWEYSGHGSEVFARNVEILERMAKRTDDDWNIVEMMTSDEEDTSTVNSDEPSMVVNASSPGGSFALTGQPTRSPTAIASSSWDELTVAHQLDLVHVLSERCDSTKEAMQRLRLRPHQTQRMLKLLEQREKPEDVELERVAKLQAKASGFLLAWDTPDDKSRSKAAMGNRGLLTEHYNQVNVEEFTLSTPRELAKAKAYLEACGRRPALLDHWEYLFCTFGKEKDEKGQISVSSLLPAHELESVRCISILTPGKLQSHGTLAPDSRLPLQPKPFYRPYLSSGTHPSEKVEGSRGSAPADPNTSKDTAVRRHGSALASAAQGSQSSHAATSDHNPAPSTPHSPMKFIYPISPASSPPPRKTAKLEGHKIARHSYPTTERPCAVQGSRKAPATWREDMRLPAANIQPYDTPDRRLSSETARKKRRLASERRTTTASGSYPSTNACTSTDNTVAPTMLDLPERKPIPTAPMVPTKRASTSVEEST